MLYIKKDGAVKRLNRCYIRQGDTVKQLTQIYYQHNGKLISVLLPTANVNNQSLADDDKK